MNDKNLMTRAISYLETYAGEVAYSASYEDDVEGENETEKYLSELDNFIKLLKEENEE
tara:strand:+ start:147 stop:320 length:174 start_codon:yes stop_codon:yes gene_type:complete